MSKITDDPDLHPVPDGTPSPMFDPAPGERCLLDILQHRAMVDMMYHRLGAEYALQGNNEHAHTYHVWRAQDATDAYDAYLTQIDSLDEARSN